MVCTSKDLFEIVLTSKLNNLVHTGRYSGFQLLRQETVSDHIWGMISIALDIVPMLNEQIKYYNEEHKGGSSFEKSIDIKDVIYRITIHDIDEALCCDIPRPFKYANSEIRESIEKTTNQLMEKEFEPQFIFEVHDSKNKSCIEGLLVAILDSLQAGIFMRNEVMLGNQFIKTEINNVIDMMDEFITVYIPKLESPECIKEYLIDFLGYWIVEFSKHTK